MECFFVFNIMYFFVEIAYNKSVVKLHKRREYVW